MKRMVAGTVAFFVLVLVWGWGIAGAAEVGETAPGFSLEDLAGEKVELEDFRGKVVLLDFWSTRCPPCRKAMPHLQELHEKYKNEGLVVVGVSLDVNKRVVERFLQALRCDFLILMDPQGRETGRLYRIRFIPTTLIIDKKGVIRFRGHPSQLSEKVIEEYLAAE